MSRHPLITDDHLNGGAIVYIRQSSTPQVRHNTGSTALQRDLVPLLQGWGWPEDRIEIIDEDLGVSGAKAGRRGFRHLLDRMQSGAVRMVAVTDISRLARNLGDWAEFTVAARRHKILFSHSTQVVDLDEPSSEFVTLILGGNAVRENRSRAKDTRLARRKKAEDGRSSTVPPSGYVSGPDGTWAKDPDPAVRDVLHLLFDKYRELGSGAAVARFFLANGIRLPRRTKRGLRWVDATSAIISAILRNEAYAGTYVYGKTRTIEAPESQSARVKQSIADQVHKKDHHEPYVAYPIWLQIQDRLKQNRWNVSGVAGRGEALVQGLLRCAQHRFRFRTTYPDRAVVNDVPTRVARYSCPIRDHAPVSSGRVTVQGSVVDSLIAQELFKTLAPPSAQLIADAGREALREHESLLRGRDEEERRATQRVSEAVRAYDQADETQPYLRELLGQRVNDAIKYLKHLQEVQRSRPPVPPVVLDDAMLLKLRGLLADLPRMWQHPRVTREQRKMLIRRVINAIWVHLSPTSWRFEIEWKGGARSSVDLMTHRGIGDQIERAWTEGAMPDAIAASLTRSGIVRRAGLKAGTPYSAKAVHSLVKARRLQQPITDQALDHIRSRLPEGLTYRQIADELTELGLRHFLGRWTASRVGHAVRHDRRKQTPGGLEKVPSIEDAVRRLYSPELSVPQIVTKLREQGIVTRSRRPVGTKSVGQALRRLGLRSRSTLDALRLEELLREWVVTLTLGEITRRVNALGLKTRTATQWTYDSICAKVVSLGLRAARRQRIRDRLGRFLHERTPATGWGRTARHLGRQKNLPSVVKRAAAGAG